MFNVFNLISKFVFQKPLAPAAYCAYADSEHADIT